MKIGSYNPNIPRCQYIKTDGTQCGSPARRAHRHCYFHTRWSEQTIAVKSPAATYQYLSLPVLEDANAVQVAITEVLARLLAGEIEHKTAALALYGLQTASSNLRRLKFEPSAHDVVIDPDTVNETLLGERVWENSDFDVTEEEEPQQEEVLEGAINRLALDTKEVNCPQNANAVISNRVETPCPSPEHSEAANEDDKEEQDKEAIEKHDLAELRRQIAAMVTNAAPDLVAARLRE